MRRMFFLRFGIVMVAALLTLMPASLLYAGHDTSLRTDLNFSYNFNETYRVVSYVFIQANDEVSNYDYTEWGAGLQYQTPAAWLSLLVYYQQGYSKDEDRSWALEQKPSINLNLSKTFFKFNLSNQIRYEYRITPDWNDYRIKNTLNIFRSDLFLEPYVGWELFYENHDKAVMLNRIKVGINHNISEHVSVGPYFRMDFSNINSRWEWTRQLIGLQMTIKY